MTQEFVRETLKSYAPTLTRYYRNLRDKRQIARPLLTTHGFRLAGPANMASGAWEVDETRAFLECLEPRPACIDIGANVGFYSCLAATRGKQVVAVEPLPRNLEFLYRNLEYNGISNVEVFPMALSDKSGVMPLYGHADTASFISGWAGASGVRHVAVPATTLDTIAAERFSGVPLAIKLDVEGFELEVLKGAARTLCLNPKPAWLVEIFLTNSAIPGGINHRFSETFEVFWDSGYRSYEVDPGRRLVQPRDVNRWLEKGSIDRGSSSFVFLAD